MRILAILFSVTIALVSLPSLGFATETVPKTSMSAPGAYSGGALGGGTVAAPVVVGSAAAGSAGSAAGSAAAGAGASLAAGQAANAQCNPVIPPCECGFIANPTTGVCEPGANKFQCACVAVLPGGAVPGFCIGPNVCEAVSYSSGLFGSGLSLGSGSGGILGGLLGQGTGAQILGALAPSLISSLMGSSNSSSGNSGSTDYTSNYTSSGCQSYYSVSYPTTDPCAYYVPVSGTTDTNSTSNLLSGLTDNNTTSSLLNIGTNTSTSEMLNAVSGDSGVSDVPMSDSPVGDGLLGLPAENATTTNGQPSVTTGIDRSNLADNSGTTSVNMTGNIVFTRFGGTIVANSRDLANNTETAGFYGGDSSSLSSKGFIGSLCAWRPWANSIVSFLIPPTFFDSLCTWGGYQVGTPVATNKPAATSFVAAHGTVAPVASSTAAGPHPQTVIWASPAKVPLGGRTSVLWNSKDVASCRVTSSDGSFDESLISGGGSTVPITAATTFTVLCQVGDGSTITDSVVVDLAI